jgi:soluble P-type ATPase
MLGPGAVADKVAVSRYGMHAIVQREAIMSADTTKIVQISDMHLDPTDERAAAHFLHIRDRVNAIGPAHVVASGDISGDGYVPQNAGMFGEMARLFQGFEAPVYPLPGNHDIGNKVGVPRPVTEPQLGHWLRTFDDRFSVPCGHWQLIGLNSQIIGSDLPRAADQLSWLSEEIERAADAKQHVAVFLHLPLYLRDAREQFDAPADYWCPDLPARLDIVKLLQQPCVKFIASGHLHWHHLHDEQPMRVWCPSTQQVVDSARFPRHGGVTGFLEYDLHADGRFDIELHVAEPLKVAALYGYPRVELPAHEPRVYTDLLLDFTGTLSLDGQLLPGVAQRLTRLADMIRITVLTADTFGKAREALAGLPVDFHLIQTGEDKAKRVAELGAERVIAIGNGQNDVPQVKAAGIGIAVIGPEGCNGNLLRVADVVTRDIIEALDLVAHPLRLKATLRD